MRAPYPTHEAVLYLTERLGLQEYDEGMQDWPLEVTDGSCLREFCDLYEEGTPSQDTQDALMHLLLCALDNATPYKTSQLSVLERGELEVQTSRITEWLKNDFDRYAQIINYWRSGTDPNPEHGFAISPLLRRIWNECQTTTEPYDEKREG